MLVRGIIQYFVNANENVKKEQFDTTIGKLIKSTENNDDLKDIQDLLKRKLFNLEFQSDMHISDLIGLCGGIDDLLKNRDLTLNVSLIDGAKLSRSKKNQIDNKELKLTSIDFATTIKDGKKAENYILFVKDNQQYPLHTDAFGDIASYNYHLLNEIRGIVDNVPRVLDLYANLVRGFKFNGIFKFVEGKYAVLNEAFGKIIDFKLEIDGDLNIVAVFNLPSAKGNVII